MSTTPHLRKRCSYGGCRTLVDPSSRYCDLHRKRKAQTYGTRHQTTRQQIFENNGWRCHYCRQPVTSSDDIVHLAPTQTMSPAQSWSAAKVPAHRRCHNRHAPHLTQQQNFHA